MTVKDAYCKFKKKYPNTMIGFTAFFHFKLKEVVKKSLRNKQKVLYVSDMLQCKKVSETNRRCCMRQICCNVKKSQKQTEGVVCVRYAAM